MEKAQVLVQAQRVTVLLSFLSVSACGIGFDLKSGDVNEESDTASSLNENLDESNASSESNGSNNPNTWEEDSVFGSADLPSVLNELDESACDAMSQELQHPGATSYFVGTYIKEDGRWMGREKWILFPNEYWEASGGFPCEVSWDMEIQETEPVTCLACDFALNVDAAISSSSTTCPQELWNAPSEQYWNATYEVLLLNGTSTFYFQTSGQAFGRGYSSDKAINFVSEYDCKWF